MTIIKEMRTGKSFTSEDVEGLVSFLAQLNKDRAEGTRLPSKAAGRDKRIYETNDRVRCQYCRKVKAVNSDNFYFGDRSKCIPCHKKYKAEYRERRRLMSCPGAKL
jgi:hypothetical protein